MKENIKTALGFIIYHIFPKKRLVFICSCWRSGSTLLKALLAEADDVSNLPEINFEQFRYVNKYAAYFTIWRLSKAKIIVLKDPGAYKIPVFPDFLEVKVILLVRKVLDTSLSMIKMSEQVSDEPLDYVEAINTWFQVYDFYLNNSTLEKYGYFLVRYEDLVENPENVTGEVFKYIGSQKNKGVSKYSIPADYKWAWGSDDGGQLLKSLKVSKNHRKNYPPKMKEILERSMEVKRLVQRIYNASSD